MVGHICLEAAVGGRLQWWSGFVVWPIYLKATVDDRDTTRRWSGPFTWKPLFTVETPLVDPASWSGGKTAIGSGSSDSGRVITKTRKFFRSS